VDEDGEVRVRDRYNVTAPVTGRIERLWLRAGDRVEAGAVVARIEALPLDPRARTQAAARLESAQDAQRASAAALTQARAAFAQAQRDRARTEALARDGVTSVEAREKADVAAQVAERDVEAADFRAQAALHDVDVARAALLAAGTESSTRALAIRSPIAGRVLQAPDASARVVTAGQPLLEIGDVAEIEVTVDVLSTDAVRVQPGATMSIAEWGGDHPLKARVRVVEPAAFTKVSALGIEEQRVNVVADLLQPAPSLGDRYRVHVRIVVWEGERVLQLPWSAVFRSSDRWQVYVVDGNRARLRDVTVGHQAATDVEILSGLREGDRVVRHPTSEVKDGVRVEVR
jgi:HlyD family secretion protein